MSVIENLQHGVTYVAIKKVTLEQDLLHVTNVTRNLLPQVTYIATRKLTALVIDIIIRNLFGKLTKLYNSLILWAPDLPH